MSLLKWQELAKSKTNVGNKINFVRETIKDRKLGETMNQESYQKLFRPVTGKLDEVAKPITDKLDDVKIFRFPKNKSKKKTVRREEGDEEGDLGLDDLFDLEEEAIQPQGQKQVPPDYEGLPLEDPPEYSPDVDYSPVKYDNKILNDMGMENYKEFEDQMEFFKGGERESYLLISKLDAENKRKEITTLKGKNTRKINKGK